MAACVRMLLAKEGRDVPEADLRARLGLPPLELRSARELGEYRYLGFEPAGIGLLLGLLQVRWVAVTVTDGAAATWAVENGLASPHGTLAPPDEARVTGHHAIVLVGEQRGVVSYLDPWCNAPGQPARVALTRFIPAWVGSALYCSPGP